MTHDADRLAAVAALGCCICRRPAAVHHVPPLQRRPGDSQRVHRDDRYVLPLCPMHHQWGGYGIAVHAGRQAWAERYGGEAGWLDVVDELLKDGTEIFGRIADGHLC